MKIKIVQPKQRRELIFSLVIYEISSILIAILQLDLNHYSCQLISSIRGIP